jgi:hypothetical protein
MAQLAATDDTQFIKLCKQNQVTEYCNFTGYDLASNNNLYLESGRLVQTTVKWNPLTYALVFNKTALIDHLLVNGTNLAEMLSLGLPLRDAANNTRYTKDQLIDG